MPRPRADTALAGRLYGEYMIWAREFPEASMQDFFVAYGIVLSRVMEQVPADLKGVACNAAHRIVDQAIEANDV